ncbi:MAG TPA: hypothetical protein VIK61_08020, partial [Acidimicrobiia bacterium]
MKRCAACGQDNDDWRPFCTRCGASYAGAAAEPVIVAPPPGAPPPPPLPGERPPAERFGHRPRRPSSGVIALAAVLAVAVAVAAVVGLSAVGSKTTKKSAPTTTFPATWDSRVTDLVHFDEIARKLDYTHPVKVVFLSTAAFKKRVTADDSKLTAKDRADIQHTLESMRAMGMVQGTVDLFAKQNQLAAASYLAFYDDTRKEIVIPGASLDVEERVTLAHELTHTLDDEHFNLAKVNKVGDQHDTDAVTALVEGDAVSVENQFVAKLSASDRVAYDRSQQTGVSQADLKGVPKILELLQQWPYDFGPIFVGVLQKLGGQERVNAAFRSPPIDEEQVIDPIAYYNADLPAPIKAPVLPRGAKKLDSAKEFGALAWYLVLSERIDAHVALKAALGWGADTYTVAREGKQTCMEIRYRGETRQDNAEMLDALHRWIAALPRGMASVKVNTDNTMTLHSCDPGTAAK